MKHEAGGWYVRVTDFHEELSGLMTSYRGEDRSCASLCFLLCWALRLISEELKDGQQ